MLDDHLLVANLQNICQLFETASILLIQCAVVEGLHGFDVVLVFLSRIRNVYLLLVGCRRAFVFLHPFEVQVESLVGVIQWLLVSRELLRQRLLELRAETLELVHLLVVDLFLLVANEVLQVQVAVVVFGLLVDFVNAHHLFEALRRNKLFVLLPDFLWLLNPELLQLLGRPQ